MTFRWHLACLVDHQEIATSASWPTLIRGCELPDHGLGSDRAFAQSEYRIEHLDVASAPRPPFWRYLSDAGVRSVVLSAYSAPMLDDFHGAQVTGWGSHDPFEVVDGALSIADAAMEG